MKLEHSPLTVNKDLGSNMIILWVRSRKLCKMQNSGSTVGATDAQPSNGQLCHWIHSSASSSLKSSHTKDKYGTIHRIALPIPAGVWFWASQNQASIPLDSWWVILSFQVCVCSHAHLYLFISVCVQLERGGQKQTMESKGHERRDTIYDISMSCKKSTAIFTTSVTGDN